MPLVANIPLPSFARLKQEGVTVMMRDKAEHQDIRELHIGLLNMMPDNALAATERQFFRLIGESNQIAQFYLHPFTLKEIVRGTESQAHVDKYYKDFEQIKEEGLDALIITGANVVGIELMEQPFWEPLTRVVNWAYENVASTLCSCLATHAVLQFRYQQKRVPLLTKRWGIYTHCVIDQKHPLVFGVNTRFDLPHSRFNEISRQQFENARLKVLVDSEVGVHLAVSEDGFRLVFFQGHPEYDTISLLKEYKREVGRYINQDINEYPASPDNYFSLQSRAILGEFRRKIELSRKHNTQPPTFPEQLLTRSLENTWHDSAEAIVNKWIGKVYQSTNIDRRQLFSAMIDPNDPLNLKHA